MLARLLGLKELGRVSHLELYLRHRWPVLVALVLIVAAIGVAGMIYRRELGVSKRRRTVMGVLRALLYAVIILLIFEPVLGIERAVALKRSLLVLVDTSESMGTQDQRKGRKELEESALALGLASWDKPSVPIERGALAEVSSASRLELARSLLDHPELDMFDRLARQHKLRLLSFGRKVEAIGGDAESRTEALAALTATAEATRLGGAIEEAVARYGGQDTAGVVLLTDGASNEGLEPEEAARRLGERGIPLFPVGIGLPHQPDVRIRGVVAQEAVFPGDRVPVRVQLDSVGFAGQMGTVTVKLDGTEVARKPVRIEEGGQFVELSFPAPGGEEQEGLQRPAYELEVDMAPLPGEATDANNSNPEPLSLRVVREPIKVLYIEGKPRWEYRYLRAVLLRDPRLDVQFLMTRGDRDLARASDRYLADFPEAIGEVFPFDLVILGDVPAREFSRTQLAVMEELIRKHGGSLLMLAGPNHAPMSYAGTPIADILPVRTRPAGTESVSDVAHPILSDAGHASPVMTLESGEEANAALWALVRPLYEVPALDGPKPGAEVLAVLPGVGQMGQPYPLIAWQRYRTGKSLFVGTDQLWRLRFKRGDTYHARFWGQVIQFLTLSRKLGEDRQIRLETDQKSCRTGERIQIYANVLDDAFQPYEGPGYTVHIDQVEPPGSAQRVRLEPVKGAPGLYQGFFTPTEEGRYRVRTDYAEREKSNAVELQVVAVPLEQLERSMQEAALRKMAELSGGHYFRIHEVPSLPEAIAPDRSTAVERRDKELFDLPLVFIVLLGVAGTEWFLRRRYDLI
jgi:hypothetical protein